MAPSHFDLVSHWRIRAPAAQVWAALADTESWPRWWPQVRSVQRLAEGGAGGVGRVQRICWRTGLGYEVALELESVEVLRPQRLRGRARGTLQGEGIWLLHEEDGRTDVTYVWRVQLHQPWMRVLAPLLAPLFRWNHERVMRAGERGLARHLA